MADLEFSHLSPGARASLRLSDEDRILRACSDRWIGYTRAKQVLGAMEDLLVYPTVQRPPNLLITGDTGNGKSAILKRFLHLHPVDPNPEGEKTRISVLFIESPPVPKESELYFEILSRLNAAPRPAKVEVQRERVVRLIRNLGVRMILIDEIHNAIVQAVNAQRQYLNAIKWLSNELKIPFVAAGTAEAYRALQVDPQLSDRFERMPLPRWKNDLQLKHLLASFELVLPLRRPSGLGADDELTTLIFSKTSGRIGPISRLLAKAATEAIRSKRECIDRKLLNSLSWTSPDERYDQDRG